MFHNLVLRANKCKFIYIGLYARMYYTNLRCFFILFILQHSYFRPLDIFYICTENGVMTFLLLLLGTMMMLDKKMYDLIIMPEFFQALWVYK